MHVYVNVLCMRACVAYMSVYGCAHDKVSKSYRTKYTIANNCMIQWQHIDCTCIGYFPNEEQHYKVPPLETLKCHILLSSCFISCTYVIVIVNSLPKEVFPFLFVHMYMYMNAPHSIEVEAGEWNLCYCSIIVVSLLLK